MKNVHRAVNHYLPYLAFFISTILAMPTACLSEVLPEPAASPLNTAATPASNMQAAKEMEETLARLSNAANEVTGEVSRRQQVVVSNQHVFYDLTNNMMSQPFAGPPETEDVGPPLPPRKKWLDYGVSQLQKLFEILSAEVDALTVPTEGKRSKNDELRAQLDVAHDNLKNISSQLSALKTLTVGPNYDGGQIAAVSARIQTELSGLNTVRKRLIRLY